MSLLLAPLGNLARRAARGGRSDSRGRRYVMSALVGIAIVWAAAAAYVLFSPRSYTSTFVLVLPGTGAASSMNLENVGSASSTTAPAFSPDVSPTENYRKILLSYRLRVTAADLAGETPERFPIPKVDLADQTKLITVAMGGTSPEHAARRAEAVRTAFRGILDTLRQDEIVQRDTAYRDTLGSYKQRVQDARQRLIEHQARSGLSSLDQYGTIVATVERLREQQRDTETRLVQGRAAGAELVRLLGITPELAANAMVLRADPMFQSLLETLAKQETELALLTGIRGPANPRLQDAQAERNSVLNKLLERGALLTDLKRPDLLKLRDVSLRDERARLFERVISLGAETDALAAVKGQLAEQLASEQQRVLRMADDASLLENLRRDMQVAEAVFTSALARNDTSKSDYFASYPMVQTLQAPLTPARPSSPQPILAIGGGLGATFLIIAALVLAWLRLALLRRILKNV